MHFDDVCMINLIVVSHYSRQQCYAGIGESIVALLMNFHDRQKVTSNKKPNLSKYVSSLEIGVFHALTWWFQRKYESTDEHSYGQLLNSCSSW